MISIDTRDTATVDTLCCAGSAAPIAKRDDSACQHLYINRWPFSGRLATRNRADAQPEQGYIAPHSAPDASRESLSDTQILTGEAPVQQSADVLARIASHAADTLPQMESLMSEYVTETDRAALRETIHQSCHDLLRVSAGLESLLLLLELQADEHAANNGLHALLAPLKQQLDQAVNRVQALY